MIFNTERKKKKRNKIIWIIICSVIAIAAITLVSWISFSNMSSKYGVENKSGAIHEKNKAIASQAYIYGSPAIKMYEYFYDMAVDKNSKYYSRINKFLHVTKWAQPGYTTILNNDADTLNSVAWLDLTLEPIVIYCPDTSDNYYSLEILDFYGNCQGVFYKSPSDPSKCNFLITTKDWEGTVPAEMEQIIVDTPYVLAYVKLMVPAPNEIKRMKESQAKFDIRPLSRHKDTNEYEGVYKELPKLEINNAIDFYNALNFIMSVLKPDNVEDVSKSPPPDNEKGLLDLFSQIGVSPGKKINESELSKEEISGINAGYELGIKLKKIYESDLKVPLSGGFCSINASGAYTGDYYRRAALAELGLKVYNPQHFLELSATYDKDGIFLNGKNKYEVRFSSPPPCVEGWSLTLYRASDGTLVSNESNVYKIGSRSGYLKYNDDNSLSIFVSNSSPNDKINNWLPAPQDDFYLVLRVYLPKQELLVGEWDYPQIIRN